MFVPAWPPLPPSLLFRRRKRAVQFPFTDEDAEYFFRASNAIYYLFIELRSSEGQIVLVPDFHSGNEIAAIRAAGFRPVAYPILGDLGADMPRLRILCDQYRPSAVLLIHTLGMPQDIDEFLKLREEYRFLLIEDCAHALYGQWQGRPLGSFGDYAIFCPYKTLPVPNGGVLVKNKSMSSEFSERDFVNSEFISVSFRTASMLMDWTSSRVDWFGLTAERIRPLVRKLFDRMLGRRLGIGEMGFDLDQVNIRMSRFSRRLILKIDADEVRARRRFNFQALTEGVRNDLLLVKEPLKQGVCPLLFPIVSEEKAKVVKFLKDNGIAAVEFWNQPDPRLKDEQGTGSRSLSRRVIGVPVHQDLLPKHLQYIIDCVNKIDIHN
jgi:dTDP-4-amino-4,6-dideoxygalactose transaminase